MQDDRSAERGECGRRLDARLTAVDHDRQPELVGEPELGVEQGTLLGQRAGPVMAVEPSLAHGDGPRTAEEPPKVGDPVRLRGGCLVGVDPQRGEHARDSTPRSRAPADTNRCRSRW